MLLAELEIRHSRAIAPTRRVALGALYLPAEPAPGFGGLLLAAIVAGLAGRLDEDGREQFEILVSDLERGRRIPQPRLRYRFQSDVHGLDRSRHRLVGDRTSFGVELDDHGGALPQVLGAVYAASKLSGAARPAVFRLIRRATRWEGDAGDRLMQYLSSDEAAFRRWAEPGDERWALTVLGFARSAEPARGEILGRFRSLVREAHPDHGGQSAGAGDRIHQLSEAKRILLAGA